MNLWILTYLIYSICCSYYPIWANCPIWQRTSLSWLLSPFDTTLTLAVFEFLLVESSTFRDHNLGANGTRCYWLIIFSKPFEWIEIEKYKFINFKTFTDKNTYCILADISNSDLGLHCFYFYLTTVSPFTPAENSSSQSHWVWQEKFT